MSRGYMSTVPSEYICWVCGDVCISFDASSSEEKKYNIRQIYCPICKTETEHIKLGKLGDKDLIKAKLESQDLLEGIDFELYNLLTVNENKRVR